MGRNRIWTAVKSGCRSNLRIDIVGTKNLEKPASGESAGGGLKFILKPVPGSKNHLDNIVPVDYSEGIVCNYGFFNMLGCHVPS
jgi:hypothetical protein